MTNSLSILLTHDGALKLHDIEAVAHANAKVALEPKTRERLRTSRHVAEQHIKDHPEKRVYGVNTGFGSNYKDYVSAESLKQLQKNLILSHCVGVGPYAPAAVVRATILLRAASLSRGRSVVRPEVVETLIAMLNENVIPAVPRYGSVSASGDLAPLSHIAAVVIGSGRVLAGDGGVVSTTSKGTFKPIELEMKEGLALNNGCQYANAWGALATAAMIRLAETSALSTALHLQALRGMGRPFRPDLHELRPHPGSVLFARWVFDLLDGYSFRDVSTDVKFEHDGQIQDPYNLRCAAQVLGPCLDLIRRAEQTMEIEARSVTDNPIDLNSDLQNYDLDKITSGGHFHGMPLAIDVFGLLQAAGIMARLSNLRCARIVDEKRNKGLGPQVRGDRREPTESGLMIAEYTTAGLCNHIWGLTMPSHLMSLSTDSGQEDHVSMAANVAMRSYEAAERLGQILAIELAFASQAECIRAGNLSEKPVQRSDKLTEALKEIGAAFPPWRSASEEVGLSADASGDRELSLDIEKLAKKVLGGDITRACGYKFDRD